MSENYGIEADITLNKASVAGDHQALEALNKALDWMDDWMDTLTLSDLDAQTCLLSLSAPCIDRTHTSIEQLIHLIETLKQHAKEPFLVRGDNEHAGVFAEIEGPTQGRVDLALRYAREQALEAASQQDSEKIVEAFAYAGERQSAAATHLTRVLSQWAGRMPQELFDEIAPHLDIMQAVSAQ